jgi:hypothetical protein
MKVRSCCERLVTALRRIRRVWQSRGGGTGTRVRRLWRPSARPFAHVGRRACVHAHSALTPLRKEVKLINLDVVNQR